MKRIASPQPSRLPATLKQAREHVKESQKIADLLTMPGIEEIELDLSPLGDFAQPGDLS